MRTLLDIGFLTLAIALAHQAFGQSNEALRAAECRGIAENAARDINKITSEAMKKAGEGKESRSLPPDDLSVEVRNSESLMIFLQCLNEQRASLQK
jgi:hypothetical protein